MKPRSASTQKPVNKALEPFAVLIGKWAAVGTHPLMPGTTLHGDASIEWLEGGAFIIMRAEVHAPNFPKSVSIIGTDDSTGDCCMLHFDDRGVSRKYDMSLRDHTWKWWRNASDFSQRFTAVIAADGKTIVGKGELSKDGHHWEGDLSLTYTRIE